MCVPPGGTPEGIRDVAEYIVRLELFFFLFVLVFYPRAPFFFFLRPKLKIFRRKDPRRVVFLDTYVLGDLTKIQKFTYKKKENKNFKKKKRVVFSLLFCTKTHTQLLKLEAQSICLRYKNSLSLSLSLNNDDERGEEER